MRWNRGASTDDVVDERGRSGSGVGVPALAGGGGIVGVIITLILVLSGGGGAAFNVPGLDGAGSAPAAASDAIPADQDPDKDLKDFSVYVFDDVQTLWETSFKQAGTPYTHAKLHLYRTAVTTGGCGSATSAVGPFYCPGDEHVYLDFSFYDQMAKQLNAPGDFAWAYVIAHEMGHHVQNMTGTDAKVRQLVSEDPSRRNELSVRQELQADCYAGVWAQTAFKKGDVQDGDIDEALNAAKAVGDDTLQKSAGQSVNPAEFTHGTSEQRRTWFDKGYQSGDPADCDTFAVDEP